MDTYTCTIQYDYESLAVCIVEDTKNTYGYFIVIEN